MKIVSFNIQHARNYITREIDFEGLANFINEINADIYVLNEIFGGNDDTFFGNQVRKIKELTGLYCYFGKAIEIPRGDYGNAIFSKYPIENIKLHKIPDPTIFDEDVYYESRVIIEAQIKGFTVFGTHLGLAKKERENGISLLCELLKNKNKYLIFGDFNMEYDNEIFKPLKSLVFNTIDNSHKTYPSDKPSAKIDYIFTSNDVKVTSANVINKIISDHLAIYAIIEE